MIPCLNWREINVLVRKIRPEICDAHVDRVIIPHRPLTDSEFHKGEWVFRLTKQRSKLFLLFSVRPQNPYLALGSGKGPRAFEGATRSGFDLTLSKILSGKKLTDIKAIPNERSVLIEFGALSMAMALIPARPEVLLLGEAENGIYPVIGRSKENVETSKTFKLPETYHSPHNPELRESFFETPFSFLEKVEKEICIEAFNSSWKGINRKLNKLTKGVVRNLKNLETSLVQAKTDPDWSRFGELLKSNLGRISESEMQTSEMTLFDYKTSKNISVPLTFGLSPVEQMQKFFQLAKRKESKIKESEARLLLQRETLLELALLQKKLEDSKTISEDKSGVLKIIESELKKFERPSIFSTITKENEKKQKGKKWTGRKFISIDKCPIWIGKNFSDNSELTFKVARGNDVWLHVKGRPGAHGVIPLETGKTASLDALIDAGTLVVFYSGGEHWGKTQVDYTFRKHVKKVKGSKEVTYSQEKTLTVDMDSARLKRLLKRN